MKESFYLDTSDGYKLAVYAKGNGIPVIFLHGGPGGSINEKCFSFFNLNKYKVYAFDQRGCGNSKPFASLKNNTVANSVEDIRLLKSYLGLNSFILFGGSYGSTLALAYSIKYPNDVNALVLRGIFLGRKEDIDWLYQKGASYYFPAEFEKYSSIIPFDKRNNILDEYYKIFTGTDEKLKLEACKCFSDWEAGLVTVKKPTLAAEITNHDISIAMLECHYFVNPMFDGNDNYILDNIDKIKNIKCFIVHGSLDMDCRPIGAYLLSKAMNNVELYFTEASGHSPYEENTFKKLCEIMDLL